MAYGGPMIGSFYITRVRGVPIRLHFTALLFLPWFHSIVSRINHLPESWVLPVTLLLIAILLISVALHELGHTLVAQRYNIRVQDIVLTPIGGVARMAGGLEDPRHEIRVALAGPYVSLSLFAVGMILSEAGLRMSWIWLGAFARVFAYMNLMLFLFNLLPSFPMDGGRVLRGWLAQRKGMLEATRIASSLGKYLSIGFIVIGLSSNRFNLAIIGVFIFMAAGSEYRMMKLRAWQEQTFGMRVGHPADPALVEVSPPPYQPRKAGAKERPGLLGDIITTATDLVSEVFQSTRS